VINIKIISFTAIDKAGKHTQSNLLHEYLLKCGYKSVKSEFHDYQSPTGKLIQGYLYAKQEDRPSHVIPYNVSKETIELIMAADKQAKQDWFNDLEKRGVDFLILDRYILDQLVYGLNAGHDEEWLLSLQSKMRQPDLEIVIDIPAEESIRRRGKHGANDRYESDYNFLNDIRHTLLSDKFTNRGTYRIIFNGMQSVEDIHKDIVEAVTRHFEVSNEQ